MRRGDWLVATVRVWVLSDALTIIQHENVRRASETGSLNKNGSTNASKDDTSESAFLKKKTLNLRLVRIYKH